MASEHILGPKLGSDPRAAVAEANKKEAAALGVSMRSSFYVTAECVTLVVDRKASLVAADARKMVDAFAKVRGTLKAPRLQAVILLGPEQKLCSKTDTPQRARPQLQAANVAVYRLPPKE
jgi:hypothetical protein